MNQEIRAGVRRLFRIGPRTAAQVSSEADEELRAMLEARVEHLVARGWSPEAARLEAERQHGDARDAHDSARRRERRLGFAERLDDFWSDLRYAARSLRREPIFSAFIMLTLALGIGANAAMFSVADRLLLRGPAHVRDAERMVRFYSTTRERDGRDATTSLHGYVTYALMKRDARSFDGVAAYQRSDGTLGAGPTAERIFVGRATADFFPVLGVRPELGRFYSGIEDDPAGAQRVAVVSHGFWHTHFGASAEAIGKTLSINDESYLIVGVAPRGFTGAELGAVDVWTPLSLMGAQMGRDWASAWYWTSIRVIARLKPDVTRDQAGEDATAVHRHGYPGRDQRIASARVTVAPLSFNDEGREPAELPVSRWLIGVAVIVLLIACANVTNLLLARWIRRRREIAVRLALGAGRRRLVRLLLTEGLLLAAGGGTAALVLAFALATLVRRTLLSNVEWTAGPVDGRVLAVTAVVALTSGLLVGLLPALQSGTLGLTSALKSGGRSGVAGRSRLRAALTVIQASLSVVLVVGAGLFVRSIRNLDRLDLGMAPDRALAVRVRSFELSRPSLDAAEVRRARQQAFLARILERAQRIPGVLHASLAVGVPFQSYFGVALYIPGRDSLPALSGGSPRVQAVTSDYFATVGTPILRGRAFTPGDETGAERVAIISERLARSYWPGEDALGRCIIVWRKTEPCARIIGIAANTHTLDITEEPGLQYYIPLSQAAFGGLMHLLVLPRGEPSVFAGTLRRALVEVDSTLAYLDIKTLREAMAPQLRPWQLGALVFGVMGGLAALVAAVGLYSLVSYSVTQRTHEIGVRMALGAGGGRIIGLVMRHTLVVGGAGIAAGLVLALIAGRFIEPLLFRVSARDPVVIGGVAALLLGVATVAGLIPAVRAKRVNPVEALKYD
jgi:putative ABC transport system permease protein